MYIGVFVGCCLFCALCIRCKSRSWLIKSTIIPSMFIYSVFVVVYLVCTIISKTKMHNFNSEKNDELCIHVSVNLCAIRSYFTRTLERFSDKSFQLIRNEKKKKINKTRPTSFYFLSFFFFSFVFPRSPNSTETNPFLLVLFFSLLMRIVCVYVAYTKRVSIHFLST